MLSRIDRCLFEKQKDPSRLPVMIWFRTCAFGVATRVLRGRRMNAALTSTVVFPEPVGMVYERGLIAAQREDEK